MSAGMRTTVQSLQLRTNRVSAICEDIADQLLFARSRIGRKIGSTVCSGFSLIEVLCVVIVLGVLATSAWPIWSNYVKDSRQAVLIADIQSMAVFQEQYLLHHGAYAVGLDTTEAIASSLGWQANREDTAYRIADGDGSEYAVTAADQHGVIVCYIMPSKQLCPEVSDQLE